MTAEKNGGSGPPCPFVGQAFQPAIAPGRARRTRIPRLEPGNAEKNVGNPTIPILPMVTINLLNNWFF